MGGIVGLAGFLILVSSIVGFLLVTAARRPKPREDLTQSRKARQPWAAETRSGRHLR